MAQLHLGVLPAGTSEAIVLSVFLMPSEWTVYGPINGIVFYIECIRFTGEHVTLGFVCLTLRFLDSFLHTTTSVFSHIVDLTAALLWKEEHTI